jgi:hypothetical protein
MVRRGEKKIFHRELTMYQPFDILHSFSQQPYKGGNVCPLYQSTVWLGNLTEVKGCSNWARSRSVPLLTLGHHAVFTVMNTVMSGWIQRMNSRIAAERTVCNEEWQCLACLESSRKGAESWQEVTQSHMCDSVPTENEVRSRGSAWQ